MGERYFSNCLSINLGNFTDAVLVDKSSLTYHFISERSIDRYYHTFNFLLSNWLWCFHMGGDREARSKGSLSQY
jgi:hypothetical protein